MRARTGAVCAGICDPSRKGARPPRAAGVEGGVAVPLSSSSPQLKCGAKISVCTRLHRFLTLIPITAFFLAGAFTETHLRRLRTAVVVMAAGFYLQVLPSLMLLMTNQFAAAQQLGYWASKAIFAPDGTPAFWTRPDIQLYVWLRMIGDIVAGAGIAVFLVHILKALPRAVK